MQNCLQIYQKISKLSLDIGAHGSRFKHTLLGFWQEGGLTLVGRASGGAYLLLQGYFLKKLFIHVEDQVCGFCKSNVKGYKCDSCGKSFSHTHTLKIHIYTIHEGHVTNISNVNLVVSHFLEQITLRDISITMQFTKATKIANLILVDYTLLMHTD